MHNPPVILFRTGTAPGDHAEAAVAAKYFEVMPCRAACVNQLVVGRYSVLPYYTELVADLAITGCELINSSDQHAWVAHFDYYQALAAYTFPSWTAEEFPYCDACGPFVVKGRTNSKKHDWNRLMYAPDRQAAIRIAAELMTDRLIASQSVIYRKYVPLKTFEIGLNGLPFTNEWRFFYLGTQRLAYGYYWSEAEDVTSPQLDDAGLAFADCLAALVAPRVNFFVLDIAEKADGGWVLIEVNDAQMSGLSMVHPDHLYASLAAALSAWCESQTCMRRWRWRCRRGANRND